MADTTHGDVEAALLVLWSQLDGIVHRSQQSSKWAERQAGVMVSIGLLLIVAVIVLVVMQLLDAAVAVPLSITPFCVSSFLGVYSGFVSARANTAVQLMDRCDQLAARLALYASARAAVAEEVAEMNELLPSLRSFWRALYEIVRR